MVNLTVIWNNITPPFSTSDYKPYNTTNTTLTNIDTGIVEQQWLTNATGYRSTTVRNVNISITSGHKYYLSYMIKPSFASAQMGVEMGRMANSEAKNYGVIEKDIWTRMSFMDVAASTGNGPLYFSDRRGGYQPTTGDSAQLKAPIYVDLTLMFGAGNQPASIPQFEYLCQINGINLTQSHAQNITGTSTTWIKPEKIVIWNNIAAPFSTQFYKAYNTSKSSLTDMQNNIVKQSWITTDNGYHCTTTFKEDYNYYQNHKYYLSYMLNPTFDFTVSVDYFAGIPTPIVAPKNIWSRFTAMNTASSDGHYNIFFADRRQGTTPTANESYVLLKSPIFIDLTLMFGTGKQPATINEFEYQCKINGINLEESYQKNIKGLGRQWIIPQSEVMVQLRKKILLAQSQYIEHLNEEE